MRWTMNQNIRFPLVWTKLASPLFGVFILFPMSVTSQLYPYSNQYLYGGQRIASGYCLDMPKTRRYSGPVLVLVTEL